MTKKMQQNLILLAILAVGLGFIYFKLLIGPLEQKNKDSLAKLEQIQARLGEMKKRAMELPKLQAEMNLLVLEVAELEKKLPKEKELPGLLRIFTKTAQRCNLKISSFNPSGVTGQANYNEVPFQVTLMGGYHSLAQCLSSLGQEPRILSAKNMSLSMNNATKENPATVNVSFTLIAFTYKGQGTK